MPASLIAEAPCTYVHMKLGCYSLAVEPSACGGEPLLHMTRGDDKDGAERRLLLGRARIDPPHP